MDILDTKVAIFAMTSFEANGCRVVIGQWSHSSEFLPSLPFFHIIN